MATTDTPAAVEIASLHDLQAEIAAMQTHFKDKESEFNWEARESSIIRLRAILHGNAAQNWPDDLAQGIHTMTDAILKGLHSLRTTLSLATLSLIADLGSCLGSHLDNYTFDTLLQNLLRCALLSKRLVATSSMTATITFLTETPFHSKVMPHLWSLVNDKNIQARQFAIVYANAFAQAHGSKSKGPFERSGGLDLLVKVIQKGLSDAAPVVRNAAREVFWAFHSLWRERGEKLLKSMDQATQKQLLRNKPGSAMADPNKLQASRTASSSSIGSTTSQRPSLKTSNTSLRSSTSIHSDHSKSKSSISAAATNIPRTVSPSVSSTSSASNESHLSQHSRKPLVSSKSSTSKLTTAGKANTAVGGPTTATQRSTIVPRKQPSTRKPSLTELIRSEDENVRSTGILTVAEKLLEVHYSFSPDAHIPSDVPDRSILIPALLSNLQSPSSSACVTLMSWDSIAGVIGKLCSVDQFTLPLLLSMEQEQNSTHGYPILKSGYRRWKRLLKRFDESLGETLLKCFLTTMANRQHTNGFHNSNHMDTHSRHKIATSLIEWMDELVCVVVGLHADDTDEPDEDNETAIAWLGQEDDLAPSWFEQDQNLRKYLTKLIPILLSTTPATSQYSPLVQLIGHLRLVHESVFQAILMSLDVAVADRVCQALGISSPLSSQEIHQAPMDDIQVGNMSEAAKDLVQRSGMELDSTDVTEDISKISLEHLEQEDPELEAEIATLAVLSAERLIKNGTGSPAIPETIQQENPVMDEKSVTDNHEQAKEIYKTPERTKSSLAHTPPSWPRREQDSHAAADITTANEESENTKRHKPAQISNSSPFSKPNKNRSGTLIPLIDRLKAGDQAVDDALFRKLVRLAKDNPVMQRWDQGGSYADGADLWNGENNDGGNFKDLVVATLPYLEPLQNSQNHKEEILALHKQLLLCQPGLWNFWSISSPADERISIATITRLLLKCRNSITTNVMSTVDDTLDTFFFTLDGDICLDTLFDILDSELDEQPAAESQESWSISHHHPITSAFSYMAKISPRCDPQKADQRISNGGQQVLIKGCNYPQVSARKSCVDAIVTLNQLLPDGVTKYLQDLRDDQMRLVQHYITKAQNKPGHRDFSSMQRLYIS